MAAPLRYSTIQIVLHWTIAALVIIQFSVNAEVRDAFGRRFTGDGPGLVGLEPGAMFHILSGLSILALTLLRIVIRLVRGIPDPDEGITPIVAIMASLAHLALYGLLLFMPLTGAIAWFLGSSVSGTLHEIGRLVLIPLIAMHALAALVEHFVLRNDTLRRMLRATER